MKNFIKLSSQEVEESLIEASVKQLERAIQRQRMDLEDAIDSRKSAVTKVSTITKLSTLIPEDWVQNRNEALNKQAIAEAELKRFNTNFPEKA
jgi:signal recognition particle GTPase